MIVTLTMNPSVDIAYQLNEFVVGSVSRANRVSKTAGGKGLNVARVIKLSQHKVMAIGLLGGHTGNYIKQALDHDHIPYCFTPISGESRNCIAILHNGLQTEILESGPVISLPEQTMFKRHFIDLIQQANVITISGSLPSGIANDYYAQLISIANLQHKKVLLDCSGEALRSALSSTHKPYLIKPNHEELSGLIGHKIVANDVNQIANVISQRSELADIPIVVVSLGKNGALVKMHNRLWRVVIPTINVVNPVGSGDATLAGLAVGLANHDSDDVLLKRAMVFGMLNAQEPTTGMINLAHYDALFEQVKVELY